MDEKQYNILKNFIIAIFAFGIVVLTLHFQGSITKPSQYPDYSAIKGKNRDPDIKQVIITEKCPRGGCESSEPATKSHDAISARYKVKGRFSRAYLYIEVAVDHNRPLTVWDDVYFTINYYGGHLISNGNNLPVPPSEISSYLYDLRSISFYPEIKDKGRTGNKQVDKNLFGLLHDGKPIDIYTFISSDRPGRVMKEISIYYECFKGSTCSIEEIEWKIVSQN